MTPSRLAALALGAFAFLPLLAGCDDDDPVARLRAVHASADAPPVDVYVQGDPVPLLTGVAYGDASGYLDVAPGTYRIELRAAGDPATAPPVYVSPAFTVADGERFTAVALGSFPQLGGVASTFAVVPYRDDFGAPSTGSTRARVIHAGPDAPPVLVDLGDDGTADTGSLAFGDDTGPSGFDLPAGTPLQVGILTAVGEDRVTAFTTPALTAGGAVTILATGTLDALPREDEGFRLLVVGSDGSSAFLRQNPTVFALHAGPDAPPVDISAGGAVLVSGLPFGQLSGPVQVPPGSYQLEFRAAGETGDPAATAATPPLEAGERYLAIAAGFLGGNPPDFTVVPVAEGFERDAANARVRLVHAASDAPPVDVGPVDGSGVTPVPDFTDRMFGETSPAAGTPLSPGPLTIGVAATGETEPVATFDLALDAGLRLFAVAGGSLADVAGPTGFRLLIVDTTSFPWAAGSVLPNVAAE